MGHDKLLLPLDGSLVYERVITQLYSSCRPLLIVGRKLPLPFPMEAIQLPDLRQGDGPLSGLAAALSHADQVLRAPWILVAAGDLGLIDKRLVRRMCQFTSATDDIVMPIVGNHPQPLFALYRSHLAGLAVRLLEQSEKRIMTLTQHCRVQYLPQSELGIDSDGRNADLRLMDLDTPEDYLAAQDYLGTH